LSWALRSEDIVQPQAFEDLQFSWTFKDQPFVARRAAWRTVVSANGPCVETARAKVARSLAHNCTSTSDCSGNAMTAAAFEIPISDREETTLALEIAAASADEIAAALRPSSSSSAESSDARNRLQSTQAVAISIPHLRGIQAAVLAFLKSGAREKAMERSDEEGRVTVKSLAAEPGLAEVSFAPISISSGGNGEELTSLVVTSADLRALLDMVDFISMHERTLCALSFASLSGMAAFTLGERELYEGRAKARQVKRYAKIFGWAAFSAALAWALVNRGSPRVQRQLQRLEGARETFTSAFVEKYKSSLREKGLQLPETEDVSATAIRKNKYTVGILKAILKTAAESDAGAMKRKGIKGEMKYQVICNSGGQLLGVSPANTEAIARWKDLVLVRELKAKNVSPGEEGKEDMFVFVVTIHEDGLVDVEPWNKDIEY